MTNQTQARNNITYNAMCRRVIGKDILPMYMYTIKSKQIAYLLHLLTYRSHFFAIGFLFWWLQNKFS